LGHRAVPPANAARQLYIDKRTRFMDRRNYCAGAADSGQSRPLFRDDPAHRSEMMSPGVRKGEAPPAGSHRVRSFGLSEGGMARRHVIRHGGVFVVAAHPRMMPLLARR